MKTSTPLIATTLLLSTAVSYGQEINSAEFKTVMKKVANWQVEHFGDSYSSYNDTHRLLGLL